MVQRAQTCPRLGAHPGGWKAAETGLQLGAGAEGAGGGKQAPICPLCLCGGALAPGRAGWVPPLLPK